MGRAGRAGEAGQCKAVQDRVGSIMIAVNFIILPYFYLNVCLL